MKQRAVVLFSGGIDSTTALHWARREFSSVIALTIDYGQRHRVEVRLAEKTVQALACPHLVARVPLTVLLRSALLDRTAAIPDNLAASRDSRGMPFTYIPFRNGIFLALAAGFAESRGIFDLVTGFNRIDTPDYPDTSAQFTQKMEEAIQEGTSANRQGVRCRIHTPLINMRKSEIIRLGLQLGADYAQSISCYRGRETPCGRCPACEIRDRAFLELGIEDPLRIRLKKEKRK